tara:strand:- start:348 stop:1007 length:660 start_codon:yes stop_codon:yes gene_type:complete
MGYFRELPNVEYQSFLSDSLSSQSYLTVKNLFRRNKLRDDLQNVFTIFDKYEIVEGARPDTVAEDYYGDAELDWVVLITAGIINVRNEWPLSNRDLYQYAYEVHGDSLNSVRYYKTTEVKDSQERLILPAGKIVDSNFTIPKPDTSNEDAATLNPVIGVTNWEYEVLKNNKKSSIYLLKINYLQQFLNDMRDIMVYQQSSQRIDDRLIRTENTKVSMPI